MLKDKAIENLAAGDLLLDRGHVNAATSRYYYSMYQAAVHRLTAKGFRPGAVRSGAVEWDHSMVLNNARSLRHSWADVGLYAEMRHLRGVADYGDGAPPATRLAERGEAIRDFVEDLTR